MVDDVSAYFGRLDILINCIGLNQEAKAEELAEKGWDRVVDGNLKSAMFQAQAAARHMIAAGGGKQVHISFVRGQLGLRGRGYAAYCEGWNGGNVQTTRGRVGAAQDQRQRGGTNLFGNCLIAIDARTGKRLLHFQAMHHDIWDYDLTTSPKLLTVRRNGKRVDIVAQAANRDSFRYSTV